MNKNLTYLLVDFLCLFFPLLFSFYPKAPFYKQIKHFLLPCLISATAFIFWDMLFTKLGVWSFNSKYVTGIYFFNLPIEEVLFFLFIPYACVFTFFAVNISKKLTFNHSNAIIFSWILALGLLLVALVNFQKLYTSVTFFLASGLLFYHAIKKTNYMATFYISFVFILIPFFIANGILTGSFIDEPVVIYNNNENLGIRMFTIPFEDTFYGMLLILLNVTLFQNRLSKTSAPLNA